jgi:putative endonuclease
MWCAYALQSRRDGWLYVGMTSDVKKRVVEHNRGYNRSTKARVPFQLIYVEECTSRQAAREREKYLKSGKGREFLKSRLAGN